MYYIILSLMLFIISEIMSWTKEATRALLALYEVNIESLDHPKKKSIMWSTIVAGLLELGIEV